MSKLKAAVGTKIARLEIISYTPNHKGIRATYLTRCECGTEKTLEASSVLTGNAKSCGCLNDEQRRTVGPNKRNAIPHLRGFKALMNSYTAKAKRRNQVFDINNEDFLRLTSSNCHYCGIEPKTVKKMGRYKGMTEETFERAKYVYNGLDRIDNNIGYIITNVVPCCKKCNYAKHTSSQTEWKEWIDRFVSFQLSKK